MKKLLLTVLVLLLAATTAIADTYVNGYTRRDGTYVAPHYRSSPNSTTYDNYSTKGNYNPYTGERGTQPANPYGQKSYYDRSYGSYGTYGSY